MIMRIITFIVAIVGSFGIARGQGILLNAGDSWTYHFTTLDYVSTQPGTLSLFGATFDFAYAINTYPPNLVYAAFEGLPPDGLLGGGTQPIGGMDPLLPITAWQDLEGSIQFTVTEGSFSLESLTITVWRPNSSDPSSYDTFRDTISLPEPSSATLVLFCALLWLSRSWKRVTANHQRIELTRARR
jgi:hypothetical protein